MLRLVLAVCAIGATAAIADTARAEGEFGVLKEAPGVASVYYNCTACHSERLIAQQGLSRAHWADLMDWMWAEMGMHEIPEDEVDEILDYLEAHYNEDRPNYPY